MSYLLYSCFVMNQKMEPYFGYLVLAAVESLQGEEVVIW